MVLYWGLAFDFFYCYCSENTTNTILCIRDKISKHPTVGSQVAVCSCAVQISAEVAVLVLPLLNLPDFACKLIKNDGFCIFSSFKHSYGLCAESRMDGLRALWMGPVHFFTYSVFNVLSWSLYQSSLHSVNFSRVWVTSFAWQIPDVLPEFIFGSFVSLSDYVSVCLTC